MDEIRLAGGNISPVYRVGNTVRRVTGPWTPAVHELLDHLEGAGFGAAPRVLGIDDAGREMLSYLDGDTVGDTQPFPAWVWTDTVLVECAELMRRYHDSVRTFRPAGPRRWRSGTRELHGSQVICHNDWAPYNVVGRGGHLVGVIDWDIAGPGLPASDLAFTAWSFVPLSTPEHARLLGATDDPDEVQRRLRLICDAYGLERRDNFVTRILARARSSVAGIREQASRGDAAFAGLIEAGHVARMERDVDHITAHAERWQRALGT